MTSRAGYMGYGLVFAAAFLISAAVAGHFLPGSRVIAPHIDPVNDGSPLLVSSQTFPFEQWTVTITVPVNSSVYRGARLADKSVIIYGNISENVWLTDSYRSMMNDPAQAPLYDALTGAFRKVRAAKNLTSDEYLELMAVYVQSLRYETVPENPAKFPVETVMERAGDCDDKSLLLAGLLSHEGYRVALLSFGPEAHMAVGVGAGTYLYKNTGYAFIETTNFSYVGVPTEVLESGLALQSDPVVIPIGNGTLLYGSGDETRYISDAENVTGARADAMEPQIRATANDLDAKQAVIASLEARMAGLLNSGDMAQYNAEVPQHNTLVTAYNAELSGYQQDFALYQHYAEIHNYILLNVFNRKGVYTFVRNNMTA